MKLTEWIQKLIGGDSKAKTPPPGKPADAKQIKAVAGGTGPSGGSGDTTRDSPTDTEPSP